MAQPPDQQKVLKNLAQFGVALAGVAAKATQEGKLQLQPGDAAEAQNDLTSIAHGYTFARDMNRGVIALLNTNAEIVFTGIDVVTEGASIIATAPLRIAKSKALDLLSDRIQADAQRAFARDITQYVTTNNLDYDSLRLFPEQLKDTVSRIPAVRDLKTQVGEDAAAQDIIDRAVVGLIVSTSKQQLDLIAANTTDIDSTKNELVRLGQAFNSYKNDVSCTLQSFQDQLSDIQSAVDTAQQSLADLDERTRHNAAQLGAIGDVVFSRASAQDRLSMLRAGFKKDELSPEEYNELIQVTESDAKREAAQAQMRALVSRFGEVTQIANNLGIHIDGLNEAASIASTATTVIGDVMDGDFLGVAVGVTGLFGHRPDPEALFRQELMKYLDENFREVNARLTALLKGQQQIMAALSSLSDQLASYDKLMHSHLDRIELKIDAIQDLTEEQFYLPYGYCNSVEQHVQDALREDFPQVNLRSFDQMAYLLNPAGQSFATVHGCIDFMDLMFRQSFGSTPFNFTPLAVQYSHAHNDPTYVIAEQKIATYRSQTQAFIDSQYKDTMKFFLAELPVPVAAIGMSGSFNKARALASAAIPAADVPSLISKLHKFSESPPSCAQGTLLSAPLVSLLCSKAESPVSYLTLPSRRQSQLETDSEATADAMLTSPLMFDALEKISEWAEFFAPVWDYADEEHQTFFKTAADFLNQPVIKPKGLSLIDGALRVDTIAIAQMNVLYGDHLAAMVFNKLWSDQSGLPATRDLLTGQQVPAAALLASGNPYLASNVLMLALDKSRKNTASGRDLSYAFALDYMRIAAADSDAQLHALFQGKIAFKSVWKAIDPTAPDADAACATMPDDASRLKSCYKIPCATIAGVDIPLPSVDGFSLRTLSYPNRLVRLVRARDSLAAMAAEYQTLDYTRLQTGKSRTDLAASMAQVFK